MSKHKINIIAADIGGTNSRFGFSEASEPFEFNFDASYVNNDFTGFCPMLAHFIKECDLSNTSVDVVSLALAGVVGKQSARLTNLPWNIYSDEIEKEFNVGRVNLLNDFQAAALGVPYVSDVNKIVLNVGTSDENGLRLALGAGTGLGLAWVDAGDDVLYAHATEGGHIDFAPVDEQQLRLLQHMMKTNAHVSYERLLSGGGLVNIYRFLSGDDKLNIAPQWVSKEAMGENAVAREALQLFVRIYGAFIGNLALIFQPRGGIYIAGGIAGKILNWMKSKEFLDAYLNKGRMSCIAEQTALYVITDERTGLYGAVYSATQIPWLNQVVNDDY